MDGPMPPRRRGRMLLSLQLSGWMKAMSSHAESQKQQGWWTTWEALSNRPITWADMCRTTQVRLRFWIRATYKCTVLPLESFHLVWPRGTLPAQQHPKSNPEGLQVGYCPRAGTWRIDKLGAGVSLGHPLCDSWKLLD